MIQNEAISLTRTYVPLAVGWLASFLAIHFSIVLDAQTEAALSSLASVLLAAVYYLAVRALERKWPQLGILLGVPAKPTYPQIGKAPAKDAGAADVVTLLLVVILIVALILLFHGRIT